MTQVERKVEKMLRVNLSQQIGNLNTLQNNQLQKDSVKLIFNHPISIIQKKTRYLLPQQKLLTEGGEKFEISDTKQNEIQDYYQKRCDFDKDKNIKIFKRKVRKTNKTDNNQNEQLSFKQPDKNYMSSKVRGSYSKDQQLLPSTDESNYASSQKKKEPNQKILSLRSLNNKILPLYSHVEDVVTENDSGFSPKKSLSSYSILQQKFEPNVLERNQLEDRNNQQQRQELFEKLKQGCITKKLKKQRAALSESFILRNDLNTLEINRQSPLRQSENQVSIQDYVFFREGKILQQFEKLQNSILNKDDIQYQNYDQQSHAIQPQSYQVVQQNNQQTNKNEKNTKDSTDSLRSHLKVCRIQGNALREKRLSILQDYKSVDFKDLNTSSSSSSSSTSSLCSLKNIAQNRIESSPIKNLYNISPEKKPVKSINNKISQQKYQRNSGTNQIQVGQTQKQVEVKTQFSETPSNNNQIKNQKGDFNIKYFLKSQKKLIRNFNTNRSPSNNISTEFNNKKVLFNNKMINNQICDYDIKNDNRPLN